MMRTMITVVLPSLVLGKYVAFDDGCKDGNGGEIVNCCPSWLYYPTTSFKQTLEIDNSLACGSDGSNCEGHFNGVLSTTAWLSKPARNYNEFQAEIAWTILPCSDASSTGGDPPVQYMEFYKCEANEPTNFFTDTMPSGGSPPVTTFALKQEATRADGIVSTTYYTVQKCERSISDIDPKTKKAPVKLTIVPQCCVNKLANWPPSVKLQWANYDKDGTTECTRGVKNEDSQKWSQNSPSGPCYGTCVVSPEQDPSVLPPGGGVVPGNRPVNPSGPGKCQGDANLDVTRPDARFTGGTADRAHKLACEQFIITRDVFDLVATLNPTGKNKNAGQIQFDISSFKSGCSPGGSKSSLSGKFYPVTKDGKSALNGFGAFLGPLWLSLTSLVVLFALFVGGWMYLFMATGCCALCIRCCKPPHTEEDDLFHDKELKNVTLRFAVKSGLTPEQRADDDKTMSARAVRT